MKSTDLVVLKFMLNEYDWMSSNQSKEQFIREFSKRTQAVKVVKRK